MWTAIVEATLLGAVSMNVRKVSWEIALHSLPTIFNCSFSEHGNCKWRHCYALVEFNKNKKFDFFLGGGVKCFYFTISIILSFFYYFDNILFILSFFCTFIKWFYFFDFILLTKKNQEFSFIKFVGSINFNTTAIVLKNQFVL